MEGQLELKPEPWAGTWMGEAKGLGADGAADVT